MYVVFLKITHRTNITDHSFNGQGAKETGQRIFREPTEILLLF